MKTLYFDPVNAPIFEAETSKASDPERFTIMGAGVYISQVLRALLRHSSFDRIIIHVKRSSWKSEVKNDLLFRENQSRVKFIDAHELSSLAQYPDLIMMCPHMDLSYGARIRRRFIYPSAPLTGIIHSLNYASQSELILRLLLGGFGAQDAIICSSTAGRSVLRKCLALSGANLKAAGFQGEVPTFKLPVIPLGIDPNALHDSPRSALRDEMELDDAPVLLYFGRFSPVGKSDLFPLLLGFKKIREKFPTAVLVLAGDDTYSQMSDALRSRAREVLPDGAIRVVPNPNFALKAGLYSIADIFVSLSDNLQETFGISVVEAMACGVPAVVSDWDGYRDLVDDGETGFRVRTMLPTYRNLFDGLQGYGTPFSGDLVAATTSIDLDRFASSVCLLLENSDLRLRMGAAARTKAVNKYAWPVVISAYEELWKSLLAEGRRAAMSAEASGVALDPYCFEDIFSEYPSECLTDEVRIRLADPSYDHGYPFERLFWLEELGFRFQISAFDEIINFLGKYGPSTIASILVWMGKCSGAGELSHRAHLYRLIKYGIVSADSRKSSPASDNLG